MKSDDIDRIIEGMSTDKNSLRKAAEMALEGLETLWDILDDIDTASDMAKENDAWYRKRVEALQKKRWDTMITTDGYKLKGGPVEALRQALAHKALDEMVAENQRLGLYDDAVNISADRVDETAKDEHEPLYMDMSQVPTGMPDWKPGMVFPAPKREWAGLTHDEVNSWELPNSPTVFEFAQFVEAKLKEKNT